MTNPITELQNPILVQVVSKTLPFGVTESNRRGQCIAWYSTLEEHQWLVVFDETGEFVWVPIREIRMRPSWSNERRYQLPKSSDQPSQ
jgi:hypothetical protein